MLVANILICFEHYMNENSWPFWSEENQDGWSSVGPTFTHLLVFYIIVFIQPEKKKWTAAGVIIIDTL